MQITNDLIMLGIALRDGFILSQFVNSRDNVIYSLKSDNRIASPGACIQAGHRVDQNRDAIVEVFLAHPQQPDWLLFLDADMDFPPNLGQRLTRHRKPLVGGLYFQRGDWFPMAFLYREQIVNKYGQPEHRWDWCDHAVAAFLTKHNAPMQEGPYTIDTDQALLPCDAIASGAMCIHRSVLEALKPPWFQIQDGTQTDDFQFCHRVKQELDLPIYCDLSTICGHFQVMSCGHKEFRERMAQTGYIEALEA